MAVPKKKISKAKKNMRRSHDALKLKTLATCSNCGEPKRPHRVCLGCGYYKGRKILGE